MSEVKCKHSRDQQQLCSLSWNQQVPESVSMLCFASSIHSKNNECLVCTRHSFRCYDYCSEHLDKNPCLHDEPYILEGGDYVQNKY